MVLGTEAIRVTATPGKERGEVGHPGPGAGLAPAQWPVHEAAGLSARRLAVGPGKDVGAAPSTSPCSEQQGLSGDPPRRQPGRASRGLHSP